MNSTEIHLSAAESNEVERITDNLHSGYPDAAYLESFMDEVERILLLGDQRQRVELMEYSTLSDIVQTVAERRARRALEAGDLDEAARKLLRDE